MQRYIKSAMSDLNSEDVDIRVELAYDTDIDISTLISLSEDAYPNVRSAVAENPKTPVDILEKLSNDADWGVRRSVAQNPNTPLSVLTMLGFDVAFPVRQSARVRYDVELTFCGMIGASESISVLARAGITDEEEMWSLMLEDYDNDLMDLLEVTEVDELGDDDWDVTVNFGGYIGCDEVYNISGASDEEEASYVALHEAVYDFSIESFKCVGR